MGKKGKIRISITSQKCDEDSSTHALMSKYVIQAKVINLTQNSHMFT